MKKLELYICEVCGTQYKDKNQCVQCEKHHAQTLTIIDKRYLSAAQDESGMPMTITVRDERNGKIYTYKR